MSQVQRSTTSNPVTNDSTTRPWGLLAALLVGSICVLAGLAQQTPPDVIVLRAATAFILTGFVTSLFSLAVRRGWS